MSDLIKRSDAIKDLCDISNNSDMPEDWHRGMSVAISALYRVPSADRPQGKWKEKTTFHNADDNPIIEEWQSAKCSVCGKYHTTPYMYYFNDYNFCPHCGARMKGADDE